MITSSLFFFLTASGVISGTQAIPYAKILSRDDSTKLASAAKEFRLPDYSDITKYVEVGTKLPATPDAFKEKYDKNSVLKHFGNDFGEAYDSTQRLFSGINEHTTKFRDETMQSLNSFQQEANKYATTMSASLRSILDLASTASVGTPMSPSKLNDASRKSILATLENSISSTNTISSKNDKIYGNLKAFEAVTVKDTALASTLSKKYEDHGSKLIKDKIKELVDKDEAALDTFINGPPGTSIENAFDTMTGVSDDMMMLSQLADTMENMTKETAGVSNVVKSALASVERVKNAFGVTSSGLGVILTHLQQAGDAIMLTTAMKDELQRASDTWAQVAQSISNSNNS